MSDHLAGPSVPEYRRSGRTPPLTATSPWQLEQCRWYRPSPFCTVAELAVERGGCKGRRGSSGNRGKLTLPPNRKASTRLKFCGIADFKATSPATRGNTPPQPTTTAIYCSPLTV